MVRFPFHYRCLLEQQWAICQDRQVSDNEWEELYNILGETTKPIFPSITMLVCVQLKHIERGRSLFQFIGAKFQICKEFTINQSQNSFNRLKYQANKFNRHFLFNKEKQNTSTSISTLSTT